ncbi:FctA domain-containing protein [uncultured Eubacterium sp.]|uniref:Spy0128 family protein n=1 Tax=uncultured Eubacterium sp. TaxID=165185 RepID=UPI0025ED192F|nr:FctA domain-containing protein [uncultured Eubacterium sp.]
MNQKNVQKDNVTGTGKMVVEKIVESQKGGIFVLAMVLLFWCVLLFALPAMAAEKTCAVSIPVSVKMTGKVSDSQTQKNPVFTVVMEAADGRTDFPMPEQNQIQIGANGSGTFDSILYTTPGDYKYRIRQINGTDQNITYDAAEYNVTVRVTNAEDGDLEAEMWAVHPGQSEKQSQITFENKWKTTETPGTIDRPVKRTVKTVTAVTAKAPKTGDMQNPALYVIVIIIAAGVAISVSLYRKYKKKKEL